jgi:predicted kinase
MEAIIFCGIQATGKTTFFLKYFFKTHIRISMDQLNTRNKESQFLETCLHTQQPFVVDNTNPGAADRKYYIDLAKSRKFKVKVYYFQSRMDDALVRNSARTGKEMIPEIGIRGTFKRLEIPTTEEGFDEMFYVQLQDNQFIIQNWQHEI